MPEVDPFTMSPLQWMHAAAADAQTENRALRAKLERLHDALTEVDSFAMSTAHAVVLEYAQAHHWAPSSKTAEVAVWGYLYALRTNHLDPELETVVSGSLDDLRAAMREAGLL